MKKDVPWTPLSEYVFRGYKIALACMLNPITPWFFLGMATEAIGISVQWKLGFPVLVDLDFVVGVVIAMFLFYYQKKEKEDDNDMESPDQAVD